MQTHVCFSFSIGFQIGLQARQAKRKNEENRVWVSGCSFMRSPWIAMIDFVLPARRNFLPLLFFFGFAQNIAAKKRERINCSKAELKFLEWYAPRFAIGPKARGKRTEGSGCSHCTVRDRECRHRDALWHGYFGQEAPCPLKINKSSNFYSVTSLPVSIKSWGLVILVKLSRVTTVQ